MALKGASGTYSELLFAQNGAGNALAGNASAGTATLLSNRSASGIYPLPSLDQGYFPAQYGIGKSFTVKARGVITTVASTPQTLIIGCYYASSDTATVGTSLAATGAFTTATSLSSAIWEYEADFTATNTGSSMAVQGMGQLTVSPTAASGLCYGVGGTATVAMSSQQSNYLQIVATWGASNGSATNTLTCYQVFVIGWN